MSSKHNNTRETESHKRKRLTQACELCRRKKIKCDGGKPTCGNCNRLNNTCTYSSTTKKRGPRQGYIEMLEQRLAKMEKILLSPATSVSKDNSGERSAATAIETHTNEYNDDVENDSREEQHENMENASISSTLNTSTDDTIPTNNTNSQYTHSNNVTKFSNIGSKRSSCEDNSNNNNSHDATSPTSFSSMSSNFPSPPAHLHSLHQYPENPNDGLPIINVIEHMVDLYFVYLYSTIPIFDETILRGDIREKKCPDFLLLSLFAVCARFSDRPDIKENPAWHAGEKYAEKARTMIIKAVDKPSIANLQALTLLTVHEYGCGRGPRSWMYGGMAIRMAMELGLHEDAEDVDEANDSQSFEKVMAQEAHRRLFWTIYTIDKFSSAATGRPGTLQDKFCTTFLPAKIDDYNHDQYYTETLDNSRYIMLNVNGLKESQLLGSHNSKLNTPDSATSSNLGRRPFLNCFAYFIRLTSLLGRVTTYVNMKEKGTENVLPPCHPDSEFAKLDKAIEDWYDQLPMHLKNTPANFELYRDRDRCSNNRQFILLHVLHNTLRILLHRPSLVVADTLDSDIVQPEIKEFVQKSVDKCMAAVDNVTILIKEIGKRQELMPPFITYLAYTVATVIVSASFSPHPEEAQKAKQALGAYFQLLLSARNLWAMADKLYFMIRDLYAIHTNVLRRQQEKTNLVESQLVSNQRQFHPDLSVQKQQQQLQPQQQQQEREQLQQQESEQLQRQQLLLQDLQQFQMQNVTNLELPVAGSSNSLYDWTLPYYNTAMAANPPEFDYLSEGRSNDELSLNIFRLPEGYDQPLMFSSSSLALNNDVDNNSR